jgi:hypothetical protein
MLSEEALTALAEPVAKRFESVNELTLRLIAERIKAIGELLPSDAHKLKQLKDYGADMARIEQALAEATGKGVDDIHRIIETVAVETYGAAEAAPVASGKAFVPYSENVEMQQLVSVLQKQAKKDFTNLSNTKAFLTRDAQGNTVVTSLAKTYNDVVDRAVAAVSSGTVDYNSAMRQVETDLADSGLRTVNNTKTGRAGKVVDYDSGYSRRLDTAVRQNVLYAEKETMQQVAQQAGEDFGADGYEVDYHAAPRPSHAFMGGVQFAIGTEPVTVDGKTYPPFSPEAEQRLQDYGCLHRKDPIILGVSEPAYSDEEIAKLRADDTRKITYEGKEYTPYEAKQVQRKLETAARHQKDRRDMAHNAGNKEMELDAKEKITQITAKYKDFCDQTGMPTKMERMRTARTELESRKTLDKSGNSGIIEERETSPRLSKGKDFSVNWAVVQSEEYSEKLKKLSDNDKVVSAIEVRAKWALSNRDSVQTEELYAINLNNGEEVCRITDQHYVGAVKRTEKFSTKLNEADERGDKVLLLHNHPKGLPPSISDINALMNNKNVSGITVGHNGSIYKYTRPKNKINDVDYNVKLRHYKNLSEVDSIEQSLIDLQEKFEFTIEKL